MPKDLSFLEDTRFALNDARSELNKLQRIKKQLTIAVGRDVEVLAEVFDTLDSKITFWCSVEHSLREHREKLKRTK